MSTTGSGTRMRLLPEQRAGEIVRAAKDIARTDGIGALSVRSVAQRAHVTPGLITHYFSLDELVAKAYTALASEEYDELSGSLQKVRGSLKKLDVVLDSSVGEQYAAVTFVWVESWAIARRNGLLRFALREQSQAWHGLLRAVVEEGMRDGDFQVDSPDEAAWQLLALIDGTSAHSAIRETEDRETLRTLRRSAFAILGATDR